MRKLKRVEKTGPMIAQEGEGSKGKGRGEVVIHTGRGEGYHGKTGIIHPTGGVYVSAKF
jgi:hypothetical protein